ncbi:CmcJ/NvfI family oxidoreductase [Ruegeria sp. THAF33]|uniref:CmcJ/NvfI family oxidoreductase n=1 Tax=Ruegeria sp. THAF33 TaxID=2587853 RepID=UPI001268A8C4|nr:CmcJ/NvfI family oxidoreductase [Ruegeria sp. THAF33]QFT72677.1 hypothetical protein FIU92_06525 [Ruegeria sp. THAF33]
MTRTGTVNYHVHKPAPQAFVLDADSIAGNLVSPELAATEVALTDLRAGRAGASFVSDGFEFGVAPTRVTSFESLGWQKVYDRELAELLCDRIGAREVLFFDHTLRIDDPAANRRPARNVHSDLSPQGAHQRLVDILGPERARDWAAGHYAFVNLWRPVENPINTAPLGFVRPATVDDADWIDIDLIYPDRRGRILGLAANPRHDWVYLSRMTPDEIVWFNIYDNRGRPTVGHSAIDLAEDPDRQTIRKSLESRALVRF